MISGTNTVITAQILKTLRFSGFSKDPVSISPYDGRRERVPSGFAEKHL